MKRNRLFARVLTLCAVLVVSLQSFAIGWPAGHKGVMLQGFYWDSYTDTKWTNLTSQADELSTYFNLIWIPNGGKCSSNPGMGYDPIYWFTNWTSSFGNETQLRTMIDTYKAKKVGIMHDLVINHRNGVSNWTDFPTETWNGQTWHIGLDGICRNDEVAYQSGQPTPTGADDEGENFGGARDLDHTNANVQANCKAYCKFLLQDMGFIGFRIDMVKGYAGYYTKMYNQYSQPQFSVGEYWDNYDNISTWIENTGRESAAFDFPFKYAVNEAFSSGDMRKLVWKANGVDDQPAGLIHFNYRQLAVTFIDNHDTYRDGSKFTGNVPAANAFMLCSPGTPCVFLPHYKAYKSEIQKMIKIRNSVGITNTSNVTVLKTSNDCYMAEVTGTNGKLVVKIGSAWDSPSGYSSSDIKASGNDYCIWTKVAVSNNHGDDIEKYEVPTTDFTVYFDNTNTGWTTPYIHYWGGTSSSDWPGVAMTKVTGNIWRYQVSAYTTGILFNAGNGDATKTSDFVAMANHLYSQSGDMGVYDTPVTKQNQTITWDQKLGTIEVGQSVTLNATASSGLPVTFVITNGSSCVTQQGNALTAVQPGVVTIQAQQLGNDNYGKAEPISKTLTVKSDYEVGDADGDGETTVNDITRTLGYIMGTGSGNFNTKAADIDGDGEVTIVDVVRMLNLLLAK